MNACSRNLMIGIFLCFSSMAAADVTVDSPHGSASGYTCATCHTLHLDLGSTGYNNVCMSCHRPGFPRGKNKPFILADFANPFRTYSAARPGIAYQTSHNWSGPETAPEAGAQPPMFAAMTSTPTGNHLRSRTGGNLSCVSCHNPHDNSRGKFLRMANDRDEMCLDCHRSRNQRDHTTGTHPVNFGYTDPTSKAKTKPAEYNNPPLNANPANSSSDLNLRLTASGGILGCSTCHGVHYADSSSLTVDNPVMSNKLKPSDGSLLRTDLRGANANDINICTSCHAGKLSHNGRNQNIQCTDCHGGHVDHDPYAVTEQQKIPNVWLIRRYMNHSTGSVPAGSNPVYFQSMTLKNYKDAAGNGICQSCHDIPQGAGYPDQHAASDSSTCNDCHSHDISTGSFSTKLGGPCNSCHGASNNGTLSGNNFGHAIHYNSAAVFTSITGGNSHSSSGYAFGCKNCHPVTHGKGQATAKRAAEVGGLRVSSYSEGGSSATDGRGLKYTAGTCTTTCHSDGKGGNAKISVNWGTAPTGGSNCGHCHNKKGDTSPTWSPRHTTHVEVYSFTCQNCHFDTASSNTVINGTSGRNLHTNGVTDVAFSFGSILHTSWSGPGNQCNNTYCHSNGTSLAAPLHAPLSWSSAAATNCGSCHNKKNDPSPTWSAPHGKHVNTYSYACRNCHFNTVSDDATISDRSLHVNGVKDIAFWFNGYLRTSWSDAGNQCKNTYCHSDGTSVAAPLHGTLSWNAPPSIDCGSCHGDHDPSGSPSTVSKANSHSRHTGNNRGTCYQCHDAVVNTTGSIKTPAAHANQAYDVSPGSGISFTVAVQGTDTIPTQCSNVSCHGNAIPEPIIWGTTRTTFCQDCHGSTTDKDVLTIPSSEVATINITEWSTTGHGNAFKKYYSTNKQYYPSWPELFAEQNACEYCHDPDIKHNDGTNPFRLRGNTGGPSWGLNDVCMNCHKPAPDLAGVTVGGILFKASQSITATHNGSHHDTANGGRLCWDCHDAHGDSNSYMIHSKKLIINSDPVTGIPLQFAAKDPVFTGNDYVKDDFTGICQVCHDPGKASHYNTSTNDTSHNVDKCNKCHRHNGAGTIGTEPPDSAFGVHAVPFNNHSTLAKISLGANCNNTSCHAVGSAASPYPAIVPGFAPDCGGCHK